MAKNIQAIEAIELPELLHSAHPHLRDDTPGLTSKGSEMDLVDFRFASPGPSGPSTPATTRPQTPTRDLTQTADSSSGAPALSDSSKYGSESDLQAMWASALPPADGGRKAWCFLAAATMIEVLVWGLPFSVGILHVYWTNVLFADQGSEATVTLAATLQTGLLYMSAGAFGPLCTAFPRWQKRIQFGGLLLASVALIGTAFASKPWHLILSFGCIYPFAGALYLPCATLLFEWFHSKRGLAAGIMYAGTGAGGTIFPFVVTGLLDRFGYQTAMISMGVAYLLLGSVCLVFIERRIPLSRNLQGMGTTREHKQARKLDWSFVTRRTMGFGILTILLTSLGNFVPSLWIPTFADELNMTNPSGVGLIAIMNVPGNALLGYLSDRLPLHYVIIVSCLGSGLSCLLLWGFGTNSALLVVFALTFGMLGLSFTGLWSRMISIISRDDPTTPTLVWSIFTFVRGVGSVTSGPISEALLRVDALKGASGVYGFKNYGVLLIYTGLAITSGSLTGLVFNG